MWGPYINQTRKLKIVQPTDMWIPLPPPHPLNLYLLSPHRQERVERDKAGRPTSGTGREAVGRPARVASHSLGCQPNPYQPCLSDSWNMGNTRSSLTSRG